MIQDKRNYILIFILGFFLGVFFSYFSFLKNPHFFFLPQEINCQGLVKIKDNEEDVVVQVIDGDTLLMSKGYYVRILGINADEKGEKCYQLATERLKELVLGKKVLLKKGKQDKDKYCRYLREVFLDNKNIGLQLLREGLVQALLGDSLKDPQVFLEIEKKAREEKRGCQWEERERISIPVCQAKNFIGKEIITQGKIVSVFRSKNNNIFLDLERPYPEACLTLVIFSNYLSSFSEFPEKDYLNKKVQVEGFLQEYEGRAEIILKTKDQVKILD
jgi:endonuclease YncB( thermonuclease family)